MTMTTEPSSSRRHRPPPPWRRRAPVVLALLAGGCAYEGPFAEWIDDEPPPALAGASAPAAPAAGADAAGGGEAPIAPDAGPADYVRLALARNPDIRAAEQAVRRLANRIPQAVSLDDPMLTLAPVGEMAETAAGRVDVMTGVSQKLPFPGKLRARGRIAAQDVAEAVQELERVRVEVAADTRRAFWSLYFAERAIEVTQRDSDLLSRFRDVAAARYRAGTASQQDVLRADVELGNLDGELAALKQRRTSAEAVLNRLLDRSVDAALPAPAARDLEALSLRLERLLAEARRSNPEVRKVRERIEGFRRRLALARLNRWPDLTASFNYNVVDDDGLSAVANGDDQWWLGLGVNLPIWTGRLDAAEHEAMRGIMQNVAALSDVGNRVAFRVRDAVARVESEQRQAELFRDTVIPEARQTVEVSLSGYRAGDLDFLTLIDNWRRLLDFELMYHGSLARLEQSFADLQAAVGRDVERAEAPGADAPAAEETP